MSGGGNIKVVVRCRPLNSRELARGATQLIRMDGTQTIISRPLDQRTGKDSEDIKAFTFDKSYWSADKNDPSYADQQTVYNDLGEDLLNHAFDGYNCCIFAYGQTGSGKSYSMMGYGEDKGIIPRTCSELFNRINQNTDPSLTFAAEVSYIEIYNEKVRDLLNPKNKGNLKVREHPSTGPYVEDLSRLLVTSFDDINHLMDEGNKARTVAATNMNETSSRSHAVFTVFLTQKRIDDLTKLETEKVARISLVDLAGSERANSTGATGTRLKEGANINRSLTTLGKVIAGLAEQSLAEGKKGRKSKEVFVPYRDSILTWLLKDSLGGNSKTAMIAAISPADYDETLSTLRYADQAKKIKNKAVVNEDPNAKMIRELKDELEVLRDRLRTYAPEEVEQLAATSAYRKSGGGGGGVSSPVTTRSSAAASSKATQEFEIIDSQGKKKKMTKQEIIDQMQSSEKLLANLHETWEEKLKKTEEIQVEREKALAELGIAVHKNNVGVYAPKKMPHLVNLNEDPLMSECLMYQLKHGMTLVGRSESQVQADIRLSGSNIQEDHCSFENNNGTVTLHPGTESLTMVNGRRLESSQRLRSGFRIILGDYHIFRFNNPEEVRRERDLQKLVVEKGMGRDGSQSATNLGDDDADRPESPTTENSSMMGSEIMDWNYARREAVLNYYSTESNFGGLKDEDLEKIYDDITRVRKSRRTRSESRTTDLDDDDSSRGGGSVRNLSTPTMIEDGTESVSTELTFAHSELEEKFKVEKERMQRELDDQKRIFEAKINRMSRQFSQQTMSAATVSATATTSSLPAAYSDSQLKLLRKMVNRWRRRRYVAMAEMVLTSAMILKEANIISRELQKDIVYQFTVISDDAFTNAMSYWEPTSALQQFETDEDTTFLPSSKPCVGIRVIDRKNQVIYIWTLEKLKLRLQKMRNLYNFIDRPLYCKHFNWEDPFFENPCPKYTFIGGATICLWNLVVQQPFESLAPVIDTSTGQIKGMLRVLVAPIARSVAIKGPEARLLPFSDAESEYALDINGGIGKITNSNNDGTNDDAVEDDDDDDDDDKVDAADEDYTSIQQLKVDQQLLFEIRLVELSGISESEFTQVHVQYKLSSFGGISSDSINEKTFATTPADEFENDNTIPLNYSQTLSLVVTENVLDVLTNGTLAFEVYGLAQSKVLNQLERWDDQREKHRLNVNNNNNRSSSSNEPASPIPSALAITERRPEEELLVAERHDVLAWVQISELLPNGDYLPVENVVEHALDRGVFTLRQGLQRRINVTLYHTSGHQFEWQQISKVTIGNVRQLTSKGRLIDSTSHEAIPIKLLGQQQSNCGNDGATYNNDGTSQLSIQGAWDSSQHDCLFLNQLTPAKTRIILHLEWEVQAKKCAKPIKFGMDIAVRVTGRDRSSFAAASRFKKLLLGVTSKGKHLSKSSGIFLVLLKPPMARSADQLWRLNTASKYIRGEELFLGSWRPRGVSLINDYKEIQKGIHQKQDVMRTKQVITIHQNRRKQQQQNNHDSASSERQHSSETIFMIPPSTIPLPSPSPSSPASSAIAEDDKKLALLRKVIDQWTATFGSDHEIKICQEPPIPGNQEIAERKHQRQFYGWDTAINLLSEVKLISQSPNISKKGYLVYQENALEDVWIKRWFVMRRPYISIYIDESEKDETGIINVTSVRVDYNRDLEKLIQRTNVFALYTSNNAYTIQANSRTDMVDWISKIDQKMVTRLLDDGDDAVNVDSSVSSRS